MFDETNLNNQRSTLVRLDDERKAIGMYIFDMEDRSGVSVNSFYAWKRGDRHPTIGFLVAVAETLGFEIIMRPRR